MTRAIKTMLLLAGAALLFAGCNKQDIFGGKYSRNAGDPIVFGVTSSSEIGTRTEYRTITGSYPTNADGKPIQPIDWVQGDMIRIYSPNCKRVAWKGEEQWADYKIKAVQAQREMSKGTLENVQVNGLAWNDGGNHTFYGIYPSPNNLEDNVPAGANGTLSFTIPAAQTLTPQMEYAFMTAAAKASAGVSGDAVQLDFKPAFTAFKIQITLEEPTIVHSFSLTSSSMGVAGACTATYGTGVTPTYACSTDQKTLTVSFATDTADGTTYAAGDSFEFIVFAAPTNLTNLKISFNVSTPGSTNPARTNTLALKYGSGAPTGHTAGEYVTFAGTKMHVLKGLVTPHSTKIIEVNSTAVDWSDAGSMVIDIP